jgi:hypothetical protein
MNRVPGHKRNIISSSQWILKATIKTLPWILLLHNLAYLLFQDRNESFHTTLAFSNIIGIAFMVCTQWRHDCADANVATNMDSM